MITFFTVIVIEDCECSVMVFKSNTLETRLKNQEANPLQFWKENTSMYPPAMSKLAKRYLSVPASSGPSNDCLASLERYFVQKMSFDWYSLWKSILCLSNLDVIDPMSGLHIHVVEHVVEHVVVYTKVLVVQYYMTCTTVI